MSLTEPTALIIAALIGSPITAGAIWRGRKVQRTAMEKLVARITEEASEQYRSEISRADKQHREEIMRLEKQYRESIAWYQGQLKRGDFNGG